MRYTAFDALHQCIMQAERVKLWFVEDFKCNSSSAAVWRSGEMLVHRGLSARVSTNVEGSNLKQSIEKPIV